MFADNRTYYLAFTPLPVQYDSGKTLQQGDPGLPSNTCGVSGDVGNCIFIYDGGRQYGLENFNSSAALAWNSDVGLFTYFHSDMTFISGGITLYFYNVPTKGIGLPHEIELMWGRDVLVANNPLEHVILGNQDLRLDDNVLRNVTIAATTTCVIPYTSIGMIFHFSEKNDIRWLLLSQIEICSEPGTS